MHGIISELYIVIITWFFLPHFYSSNNVLLFHSSCIFFPHFDSKKYARIRIDSAPATEDQPFLSHYHIISIQIPDSRYFLSTVQSNTTTINAYFLSTLFVFSLHHKTHQTRNILWVTRCSSQTVAGKSKHHSTQIAFEGHQHNPH